MTADVRSPWLIRVPVKDDCRLRDIVDHQGRHRRCDAPRTTQSAPPLPPCAYLQRNSTCSPCPCLNRRASAAGLTVLAIACLVPRGEPSPTIAVGLLCSPYCRTP